MIVLLQVAVQHGPLDPSRGEVVHRDLDVAPAGRGVAAVVAHGADRSHDQLAVVNDGPLVHEPRPCAVVVQLDQRTGYVIDREVAPTRGAHDQQTTNRQTHARYRSLSKGRRASSGVLEAASV